MNELALLATQEPGKPFSQTLSYISFDLQKEVIGHIILSHKEQQKYLFGIRRLQLKWAVVL